MSETPIRDSTEVKKRRPSVQLDDDTELRGFVLRLYPSQEQTRWLYRCQVEMRTAWNVLVAQNNAHIQRLIDKAVEDGALPPLRPRPDKDAPPHVKRAARWEHNKAAILASKHCRKLPGYEWPKLTARADCYKPLMRTTQNALGGLDYEIHCSISAYRAVIARFSAARVPKKGARGWKPPRWKRDQPPWQEYTMIQVRDGNCIVPGSRRCFDLKLFGERIPAHAGRPMPSGAAVQGCSVVRKADGWYAAIRTKEPKRVLPPPTLGPIGVCLGLETLAATSFQHAWENPRGNEYCKLVAWRSEKAAELAKEGLANEAWDMRQQNNRYMLKYARKTQALILQEILPELRKHSVVVLGTLKREDVQGPQCRLDDDDEGGALSACGMLRDAIKMRLPGRVAEVDVPGVDDNDGVGTARKLLSKWAELQGT